MFEINMKSFILLIVIGLLAPLSVSFSAQETNAYKLTDADRNRSKQYTDQAVKLLEIEIGISNNIHDDAVKDCPSCDFEERTYVVPFDDVLSLLASALSIDPNNHDAMYYTGKVYWLRSYEGEGNYNKEDLIKSRDYLEKSTIDSLTPENRKDLKEILKEVNKQLSFTK